MLHNTTSYRYAVLVVVEVHYYILIKVQSLSNVKVIETFIKVKYKDVKMLILNKMLAID